MATFTRLWGCRNKDQLIATAKCAPAVNNVNSPSLRTGNADNPANSEEASCIAHEFVIRDICALTKQFVLLDAVVDGVSWNVSLWPSKDHKLPGIYLQRMTDGPSPVRVNFRVTIIDQQDQNKGEVLAFTYIYNAKRSHFSIDSWGWKTLSITNPSPPGLTLNNQVVLQVCVRVFKELVPGSRPVLEKSEECLTQACLRHFKGNNTLFPDIMLKMGDVKLPAHRFVLAGTSIYFKTMFQDEHVDQQPGISNIKSNIVEIQDIVAEDMRIILDFIYGVLDTIPNEQLPSLLLATYHLQVDELMEHCVLQLKGHLTWDNLAETLVLADRIHHSGLHKACVEFVVQNENRSALKNNKSLKRALEDVEGLASKLIGDIVEQSPPKKASKV